MMIGVRGEEIIWKIEIMSVSVRSPWVADSCRLSKELAGSILDHRVAFLQVSGVVFRSGEEFVCAQFCDVE